VPELAKSWEVLDEGKTYVFHLVEGVKFHDGKGTIHISGQHEK